MLLQRLEAKLKIKSSPKPQAPVKFKDAVGRKFSFPFGKCNTWEGMFELVKEAFKHVEIIGPHVDAGHFDLVGGDGEIILPQLWETMIRPDAAITMHMWPMPELPPPPPPPPPPLPSSSRSGLPPPPPPPPAKKKSTKTRVIRAGRTESFSF
ncbi:hypothetical protein K432DRAFT_298830 [Lepidopterella palustris CBS 459.81]|uniref:Ubiquitin-like domain-containing protein n=1 Tax=Lepidopterella palustris CBS 459.81 TaxID=1314670 RepID=A0A8E2JFB6_9PEZI|nr:hypothetical protein K432DRAFT_298830 [Lepidopterella palustris CBS 459.81]